MYTATLKDRLIEGGKIRWVVEFTNGTDVFSESFNLNTYSDVEKRVSSRLSELNFVDTFTIGGTIEQIEVVTPTKVETDKEVWMKDYQILQKVNELINNGIDISTFDEVIALKNKVAANFKPEYINL